MMTLKELKEIVEEAKKMNRVPTAKALSECKLVAKEIINERSEVLVFENGYVLYRAVNRKTVFPLHTCREYTYEAAKGQAETLPEDYFEEQDWYVRLVLEGEDKLAYNQESRQQGKEVSYSCVSEDWSVLAYEEKGLDQIINQEILLEAFSLMTEKQKYVVTQYFLECVTLEALAEELGISFQAVSQMISRALDRVRKAMK